MMRSMFSGVTGMITHQTKMDVIGNNISNVNTLGFKSSRVTFQEVFSQTLKNAGAPDTATGRGGTNPMQVGLGTAVAAVDILASKGSTQRTDNPTDLSIDGEGYFIVGTNDTGKKFTRAGNFTLDKSGNLVTASGLNVYGWMDYGSTMQSDGTYIFDTEQSTKPINLYSDEVNGNKKVINAVPSSKVDLSGNLSSVIDPVVEDDTGAVFRDDNISYSVPFTVYDSLGYEHKVSTNFWKTNNAGLDSEGEALAGVPTEWVAYNEEGVAEAADAPVMTTWYWKVDGGSNLTSGDSGYITFYGNGESFYYVNAEGQAVNVTGLSQTEINKLNLTRVEPTVQFKPTINFVQGSVAADAEEGDAEAVTGNNSGANDFAIEIDFSKVTQFASDSSAKSTYVDGYPSGTLISFSTGSDGIITGIYSNGRQQPLGLLALAGFQNPTGLKKVGDNLYIETTNSGAFSNGVKVGSEGLGTLSPGTLEMSNVDLSKEFTDMIVTQRGFQANGRIITTSDEMLQELVNLKR